MDENKRKDAEASLLKGMQDLAARMRELIVAMPPHDLLGYIYAQHMLKALADQKVSASEQPETKGPDDLIEQNQFLLEYIHAVLASDAAPDEMKFDEATCAELFELSRKLRDQAMFFAMASPELDFGRHAQSVQDLVLKAYKQCDRFFRYLNSADEVPLYQRIEGKYKECGRVRRSDYRVMVPIGLTVESFSPLSAFCKELPQVEPLLGKHAFISLSIDDLFVLKRFLPTPGFFAHYLEVRQSVAGIRRAHLFDEFDHLGAYLTKNRFDHDLAEQLKEGKTSMILWDGMSQIVDKCFEGEDWETKALSMQGIPEEVSKLLSALDATRASGWLSAESHVRDFGGDGKNNLAKMLIDLRKTLTEHPFRYFSLGGDGDPLFVWLQQNNHQVDWTQVDNKASAVAVTLKAKNVIGIFAEVSADGVYHQAKSFAVQIPTSRTTENAHIYEDAARMAQPARTMKLNQSEQTTSPAKVKKTGRNEPCPCGSGTKYKKCHGR